MNNKYLWNHESFGSSYPPKNADEIIEAVNDYLRGIEEPEECREESERLWSDLCTKDSVLGIQADWSE